MEWFYELEEKLLPTLTGAAREILGDVRHVELDFNNQNIQLVVPYIVKRQEIRKVEDAITQAGMKLIPDATEWPVYIPLPPQHTYTSHLGTSPLIERPFGKPESVIVYDIPMDVLVSMREAERIIRGMRKAYTFTAAFALGGISILRRLSDTEFEKVMPKNPFEVPKAAEVFSNQFHLFPGLQWKGNKSDKIFLDWLCQIPRDSRVLIFDTGTSGNGPRQVRNLLRDHVKEGMAINAGRVRLLAIVDRKDEYQKPIDEELTTGHGQKVHVTLEYRYVKRMLSEDCQSLLGHDSIRSYGYVQPVRDNCLVAVLDEEGRPFHLIASSKTAGVYSALMSEAEREPDYANLAPLTANREREMVEKLLNYSRMDEYVKLGNALGLSLITEKRYQVEYAAMMDRYDSALKAYPSQKWDFTKKEIVNL